MVGPSKLTTKELTLMMMTMMMTMMMAMKIGQVSQTTASSGWNFKLSEASKPSKHHISELMTVMMMIK